MRYCYEHPEEVRKKGELATQNIEQWSWTQTAKKIKEVLKE